MFSFHLNGLTVEMFRQRTENSQTQRNVLFSLQKADSWNVHRLDSAIPGIPANLASANPVSNEDVKITKFYLSKIQFLWSFLLSMFQVVSTFNQTQFQVKLWNRLLSPQGVVQMMAINTLNVWHRGNIILHNQHQFINTSMIIILAISSWWSSTPASWSPPRKSPSWFRSKLQYMGKLLFWTFMSIVPDAPASGRSIHNIDPGLLTEVIIWR